MWRSRAIVALLVVPALAGCGSSDAPSVSATASTGSAPAAAGEPKRATPIVAGRPARVFIMAGFDDDCRPLTPTLSVARTPAKGVVTFKPGQMTTIKSSNSGKCIGMRIAGTGIYYTAKAGAIGDDAFAVSAQVGGKPAVVRDFSVTITR